MPIVIPTVMSSPGCIEVFVNPSMPSADGLPTAKPLGTLADEALTELHDLIVKRESALNVLALRVSKNDPLSNRRGSPAKRLMDPTIVAAREALYVRGKALNHAPV